jgi:hypothetical protein
VANDNEATPNLLSRNDLPIFRIECSGLCAGSGSGIAQPGAINGSRWRNSKLCSHRLGATDHSLRFERKLREHYGHKPCWQGSDVHKAAALPFEASSSARPAAIPKRFGATEATSISVIGFMVQLPLWLARGCR